MSLLFPDGPVKMGNAPPLGDIKLELFGKQGRLLFGNGIAPGTEFAQLSAFRVKRKIAVHHGGYAQGSQPFERGAIAVGQGFSELPVGVLNSLPDVLQAIGP